MANENILDNLVGQELQDMSSVLEQFAEDGALVGTNFGDITTHEGKDYISSLMYLPKDKQERILNSDWWNDITNLSYDDLLSYHPNAPRGGDYDRYEYNVDTPPLLIKDVRGAAKYNIRGIQQYDMLLREMANTLDEHGLGYDYMFKSKGGESAQGKDIPFLEYLISSPYQGMQSNDERLLKVKFNRYSDLFEEFQKQGLYDFPINIEQGYFD